MNIIEGKLIIGNKKIAIVASRFNEFIVSKLIAGSQDCLIRHGISDESIDLIWVPGAFEIPMISKLVSKKDYDGIICLGAVIRGATSHYDYVCNEVSKGIAQVSLDTEIPIAFGILTTENIEQAIERAGTKVGNKGYDAGLSLIEMINLKNVISEM